MRYIYIDFEGIKYYIELDDENYALRQIIIEDDILKLSCRDDIITEGKIDTKNDCNCTVITKTKFNKKWEHYIQSYHSDWESIKSSYIKDQIVNGNVGRFYPQGTMIAIDGVILACDSSKTNQPARIHQK